MSAQAGGVYHGVSANGTSDTFTVDGSADLYVASVVDKIKSGTTFQAFVDVLNSGGNWTQVASTTAQTTVGAQFTASNPKITEALATRQYRFRWTVSGGGFAHVALAAIGK